MRYLIVPPAAEIHNPLDPTKTIIDRVAFAAAVGACCAAIAGKQALDAIELVDLRDKVDQAAVGSWLALTEPEYKALLPEFTRPTALQPSFILGGGIVHIRAFLAAKSEKPVVLVPDEPVACEAPLEKQVNVSDRPAN